MDIDHFVQRWSDCEGGAERANYALFLSELADTLDLPRPEPADSRSTYRFEYPVDGDFGQKLRVDLYKENCFILEAKQSRLATNPYRRHAKSEALAQEDLFGNPMAQPGSARRARWGADMDAAFRQAKDYAHRLPPHVDRPPFLITCDVGNTFEFFADFSGQGRAYKPFTPKTLDRRVISLTDLLDPAARSFFQKVWHEPRTLDPSLERSRVTRTIADHLADLSRALEQRGHSSQKVALFLSRILFILFAKDVGLLPKERVMRLLTECRDSPSTLAQQAVELFAAMDTGRFSYALGTQLQRFNGSFFKDAEALPLKAKDVDTLLEAAEVDWRAVDPAIFGTLLEHALDPRERAQLGAHYTPRPYVERLVEATIMTPLRSDWDEAQAAAATRSAQGDDDGARLELLAFHEQLTKTRVLDPACGTGNFLYVALEQMYELEAEVLKVRSDYGGAEALDAVLASDDIKIGVDPRQFLGLELNARAAIIAELVIWIGYLQAVYRRSEEAGRNRIPVLIDYGKINPSSYRRRPQEGMIDAVLRHDGAQVGGGGETYPNPRQPSWPEAEFIVGNPPFMGGKDLRAELGDAYAEALWSAHPNMNDSADLVMYWWERAADILTRKGTNLKRFGFVTTNSITQVFQRRTVARWLSSTNQNRNRLSLVFAVDDHPWTKATRDAAAVRIAMTVAKAGAHEGELARVQSASKLDSDQPEIELLSTKGTINADLTIGVDVTLTRPLLANDGLCSPGVKLHGAGFIVRPDEAAHLGLGRSDRPGIEQHIRPYLNGKDFTGHARGVYVIDLFGLTAEQVRNLYPEIYQHISLTVKPERSLNNRPIYRNRWWIFGEPRADMRPILTDLSRYIATAETSKHRIFQFLDSIIQADNMLVRVASDDASHLSILSSKIHTTWALNVGGWLGVGNDPRYSKSRCFDPFPFPTPNKTLELELAKAGDILDAFRRARLSELPHLTLTRLYNALEAHRAGKTPEQGQKNSMSPDEARDFKAASVAILAELHAEIDRLTLEAYGWSDITLMPAKDQEQAILGRLVALNAERRMEEARGQVRWLRPEYQVPRSRLKAGGVDDRQLDVDDILLPTGRIAWPREPRPQLLLIKGALLEAETPLSADVLAARFKGRKAAQDIPRLLAALEHLGQVRATGDGYTLLRAA